ncbi:MAG: 6-phosphofructokinase [Gammaproteobacteria bacterium]|nr:6-phosphofructokinase [Gammaproteobacteria bacterium]MCH9744849.1 6-phosphofructokinase [Gammaproteobacteria bacterium]
MEKCLILSSGGDAPGMNAAIRAVVRTALHHNMEVYGSEMGYGGLIDKSIFPLHDQSVANCIQRGGTILKTARCEEFLDANVRKQCHAFLKQQGIQHLFVLGGNGSFQGASLLADLGDLNVIGIPCTIDNDIVNTEYTIGFDTACNTALEAIDKIRDTASSHDCHFIIEVMGRASGFLAVEVGIAGGAEIILIPEAPITTKKLVEKIKSKRREKLSSIIVAAEADQPGQSLELAKQINQQSGITYKVCILGHTQRGGTPTAKDRKMGSVMGALAVDATREGKSKYMTAIQQGELTLVPFAPPEQATRYFDDKHLLKVNNILCGI